MNNLTYERGRKNTNNNLKPIFNMQRSVINNILSNTSRGGVNPAYFNNAFNKNPIQYAIINRNFNLYGLALGRNLNNGETRYINVIGTRKGLGAKLMQQIKQNSINNRKHYIKLSSVPKAVGFYQKQGFKNNKTVSVNGLHPMIYSFTPFMFKVRRPVIRRSTRKRKVPRRYKTT